MVERRPPILIADDGQLDGYLEWGAGAGIKPAAEALQIGQIRWKVFYENTDTKRCELFPWLAKLV